MTSKTEALKLALEALERYQVKRQDFERFADVITAIKEALAHPVTSELLGNPKQLAQPEQRTWVGLTDDDMPSKELDAFCRGARWADAKLKEKNT